MQDPSLPNALEEGAAKPPITPGTRLGLWLGIIVLFIPLAVYIYCLCPTVFVGDLGSMCSRTGSVMASAPRSSSGSGFGGGGFSGGGFGGGGGGGF